jgi:hypothetical protein
VVTLPAEVTPPAEVTLPAPARPPAELVSAVPVPSVSIPSVRVPTQALPVTGGQLLLQLLLALAALVVGAALTVIGRRRLARVVRL